MCARCSHFVTQRELGKLGGGGTKEISTRHYVNLTERGLTRDCKKIQQHVVVLLWRSTINVRSYVVFVIYMQHLLCDWKGPSLISNNSSVSIEAKSYQILNWVDPDHK